LTGVDILNRLTSALILALRPALVNRFGPGRAGAQGMIVGPIHLTGIVIIVGNYGSGKTEVAINLAVYQKRQGLGVKVADLDLVNPYFRTREARKTLTAMGIEVILPPERLLQADLPILMPQVGGLIGDPGDLAILDVGGDDAGATVLAALQHQLAPLAARVTVLQVVNPFRPNTGSVEGCQRMRRAIEASARMPVNRWVGNAHMLEETSLADFQLGLDFMGSLETESGLGVAFVTVLHDLLPGIETERLPWAVLPIHRQLVPPWRKPAGFGSDGAQN
jgi:hypothetical protein